MEEIGYDFSVVGPRETRVRAYYIKGPAEFCGYGATEKEARESLLANVGTEIYVDLSQEGLATDKERNIVQAANFTISNNIPVPVKRIAATRSGRKARYPFDALEVGQSFFVPNACLSKTSRKDGQIVFSAVPARKRHPDRKFICRAVVEAHDGAEVAGVRVWRVPVE